MKHVWIICLGMVFTCHAADLQTPKVVASIVKILCTLYDEAGIKASCYEETQATLIDPDSSTETIVLLQLYNDIPISLETQHGTFGLPVRTFNIPDDVIAKFFAIVQEQYDIAFCGASTLTLDCESEEGSEFLTKEIYLLENRTASSNSQRDTIYKG